MAELYSFSSLSAWMDKQGFPKIEAHSGFQVVKGIDFEEAFRDGKISFEEDGIYLEYEDKKLRGYMFIKEPWIERYNTYPKFHLTKCKTIEEFILNGKFKIRYEWSNSNMNDLIDKTSKNIYPDEVLECCYNCKKQLFEEIADTQDFFDSLEKDEVVQDFEVDLGGYPKDWPRISKKYARSVNYECQSCGIKPIQSWSKYYWHVHHIDGNKLRNQPSNLKCLCILCHANIDSHHKQNFSRGANKSKVEKFKELYSQDLRNIGNRYM